MASKVHCDICDEIIKSKTIQDFMICIFDWYEFRHRGITKNLMSAFPGYVNEKMIICEKCFTDFKEFSIRKKECKKIPN